MCFFGVASLRFVQSLTELKKTCFFKYIEAVFLDFRLIHLLALCVTL